MAFDELLNLKLQNIHWLSSSNLGRYIILERRIRKAEYVGYVTKEVGLRQHFRYFSLISHKQSNVISVTRQFYLRTLQRKFPNSLTVY